MESLSPFQRWCEACVKIGVKPVAQPPPCPEGRLRNLQEPPPCHHFIVGKEAQGPSQGQNAEFWDPSSLFPLLGAPESWRLPKGEGGPSSREGGAAGSQSIPSPTPSWGPLWPFSSQWPRRTLGGGWGGGYLSPHFTVV